MVSWHFVFFLSACYSENWAYFLKKSQKLLSAFETQIKFSRELLTKVGGYERAIRWIDDILPKLSDMIGEQLSSGRVKLVCHGDCWSNNILFR